MEAGIRGRVRGRADRKFSARGRTGTSQCTLLPMIQKRGATTGLNYISICHTQSEVDGKCRCVYDASLTGAKLHFKMGLLDNFVTISMSRFVCVCATPFNFLFGR